MSRTTAKHKSEAPKNVRAAVITISDSKFDYMWSKNKSLEETDDVSGKYIVQQLRKKGNEVVFYTLVPDHEGIIVEAIDHITATYAPDIIITAGGTGVGSRDVTIEAVKSIFEKSIEGFGEFFRKKSFEKLGSAALLTRATAGVYSGVVI
ncbi:MAG: MogA/MoaB family molybdenum cofactor biosynthesis protein, partial [Euryarchaeota archaeon]|nr:MogA/MoaB family molybdenum cofactor biosynthesis protein [Euryarchaeota archaeon]